MAASNYAKHVGGRQRAAGTLERHEWQARAREMAARGQDLPQAKLLEIDVISIRSAQRQRVKLLRYIRDNLSNEALAKAYGVHVRTLEKVLSYETWGHIA